MFLIYVNDMPNVLVTWQDTLFADDAVLYCSSKCYDVLQQKLNPDLYRVCNWLKVNHLTINIKKSKFMLIGSRKFGKTIFIPDYIHWKCTS